MTRNPETPLLSPNPYMHTLFWHAKRAEKGEENPKLQNPHSIYGLSVYTPWTFDSLSLGNRGFGDLCWGREVGAVALTVLTYSCSVSFPSWEFVQLFLFWDFLFFFYFQNWASEPQVLANFIKLWDTMVSPMPLCLVQPVSAIPPNRASVPPNHKMTNMI